VGSSEDTSETAPSTFKMGVGCEEGDLHRVRQAALENIPSAIHAEKGGQPNRSASLPGGVGDV
jgi:hypothetical protein